MKTCATHVDMLYTWIYVISMSGMIQIRNVSDDLHRTLKSRAALAGMSLSEYLLRELRRISERPTTEEIERRLQQREKTSPDVSPARAVRLERERR